MDYAVDVHRINARLVDDEGHAEEAVFFVQTAGADDFDARGLAQRLNDPEARFVPCEIGGRVELIQTRRIAYIEFRQRLPRLTSLEEVGAEKTPVELRLVDKESISGTLIYEAPPGSSRISDLLNREQPRFLILTSPGVVRLINRRAILRVRV